MESLKTIARNYEVSKVVIGLPYDMNGETGESARKVIEWSREVEQALNLPVELWDERLTTSEAHELLMSFNVRGQKRRHIIDKIAASIILKSYLDSICP